jgi:thioredoxin reductase (NADPH)
VFDSAIIGGGPAGASCALWLKQLGYEPCVIEKRSTLGGLQNASPYVNDWLATCGGKTGQQIARDIHTNIIEHDVACLFNDQLVSIQREPGQFLLRTGNDHLVRAKTLVLATGVRAATGALLYFPEVYFGPGAHIANQEVSGRTIAILGGGDNAFENYLFLKNKGALAIKIFARTMKARRSFVEQVPQTDVFVGSYEFDQVMRSVNGSAFDKVLVMYGWEPDLRYAKSLPLTINARGFVRVDENCHTSVPGVFAVGEVTQRMHPCCATAMADGVVAAKAIESLLEGRLSAGAIAYGRAASFIDSASLA